MTLLHGQRIHFKGQNGRQRAARFASELRDGAAEVEGATIIIKKDTDIGEKELKIADVKAVDFGDSLERLEYGSNGRASARSARGTRGRILYI